MKEYELLEMQAKMMRMAEKHGIDWRELVFVRHHDDELWMEFDSPACVFSLECYRHHKFALGVVEGKPVFEGDELYTKSGLHILVRASKEPNSVTDKDGAIFYISELTWNQPAPKTVMVELLVEDVKHWAGYCEYNPMHQPSSNLYKACRKALEQIK